MWIAFIFVPRANLMIWVMEQTVCTSSLLASGRMWKICMRRSTCSSSLGPQTDTGKKVINTNEEGTAQLHH